MARLIDAGEDEVQCSECHAVFMVVWHRSPDIDGVAFCPFCGDDVERD